MRKVKNIDFAPDKQKLYMRLRLNATFLARIVFERSEGKARKRNEIGQKAPDCCEFPGENGFFICQCGKHLVYVHDTEDSMLRQIVELPESLIVTLPR